MYDDAFEIAGSRSPSGDRVTRVYRVEGCEDESDVSAFIATLPVTRFDLPFTEWSAQELDAVDGDYDVTATWGAPEGGSGNRQEVGTAAYKFNYVMPGGLFKQSLATINSYYDATQCPNGAPDFGGAMGVVVESGKTRVDGVNVSPPQETDVVVYRVPQATYVDPAFRALIRERLGTVNSTAFGGYAAGEILFSRCVGGLDSSGDGTLEFGFAHAENRTGLAVGGITGIAVDGWDVLWTHYLTAADAVAGFGIPHPAAAYAERIFYRTELNDLPLPGITF